MKVERMDECSEFYDKEKPEIGLFSGFVFLIITIFSYILRKI